MKKQAVLTLMMVLLMFTSSSNAGYSIYRFDVYTGPDDQETPDIDGDTVVWQDSDNNIYLKQIGQSAVRKIATEGIQTDPQVSGDVVVWYDNDTHRNVYGYDLLEEEFLYITTGSTRQYRPEISWPVVVWEESTDIQLYDIARDVYETVCDDSTGQFRPAIDGSTVVWMDTRDGGYQIYMSDISGSPPYTAQRVGTSGLAQWDPDVSGDWIVWEEKTGPGNTISVVAYNKQTEATWSRTMESPTAAINAYPRIADGIVVWQDQTDGHIWAKDLLDTGSDAFKVSDGIGTNQYPAISGNTIVWQQMGPNWDIVGARLLEPSTLTVTYPNGEESIEAATSMTLTWTSTGPVDEVLIEFSADGGANWVVIDTVPDTGSYFWDPIADVDSTDCWIKITNPHDPAAVDTSDAAFEIYQIPNSITVTAPAGGEQYLAEKSSVDITWTSYGPIEDVRIEFSEDGVNWQNVAATTPNDGQYTWAAVPDLDSQTCSIRVSDLADAATKGLSGVFTVFQCDADLTADLNGDCFVNIADVAVLAGQWLTCGNPYDASWCLGN